jgi:hypothetical protein
VVSVSSNVGASIPASRAAQSLAASQAIRTWRASGSMSGASRLWASTIGSYLRASASARPLSRKWSRCSSRARKTGTLAEYMEMDMRAS